MEKTTMRLCSMAMAGWLRKRSSSRSQSPGVSSVRFSGSSGMILQASFPSRSMAGVRTATVTMRKTVLSAATRTGVMAAPIKETGCRALTV